MEPESEPANICTVLITNNCSWTIVVVRLRSSMMNPLAVFPKDPAYVGLRTPITLTDSLRYKVLFIF
jgi:hypothetical protein